MVWVGGPHFENGKCKPITVTSFSLPVIGLEKKRVMQFWPMRFKGKSVGASRKGSIKRDR